MRDLIPAQSRCAHSPRGFTLVEVLVVMGIISLLMGILLPVVEKARHRAYIVKCASRLQEIGQSLIIYSNENQGQYPRTLYIPGVAPTAGTGRFGGAAPNDVSAAIYLLLRSENLQPIMVFCPYNDVNVFAPDTADPGTQHNFTDYRKNLGYSYANPYPNTEAVQNGYQLGGRMSPQFAVAADLNPGPNHGPNSQNHEGDGQNVLYADGHVVWTTTPDCGVDGDNIYRNRNGTINASPVDKHDSVLLPAED